MTDMIRIPEHKARVAALWRRSPEPVRSTLRPMIRVVRSGSRLVRMNSALFSLWVLFPLLLLFTSDWIGLLVVFQAMTAAVRLRSTPAAKSLAAFSSMTAAPDRCEG